jgi:hypothetical protein
METRNKHVFWEALVIAIFIFGIGIFLGYLIELNRTSNILSLYQQTELDLLDNRIQDNLASLESIDCNKLFDEVIGFADRIYDEAKLLDKYDGSNQFGESIALQHKKYDLLRAELWVNSLKIKERCVSNFTTLVYFYEYNTKSLDLKSEQSTFSRKLTQIKQEKGDKVILIPIAGNLETNSINYLKRVYNITSYPIILIDEKVRIDSIENLNTLNDTIN